MSIAEKFLTMEYGPAPEDPKDALVWLDRHQRRFGHFIGGEWRQPIEGGFFDTTDPSTGERIAAVAEGSAADIEAAVEAARKAFPKWQALTPHARARYLYAMARAIQRHSRRLAVLETIDNGKPIRESRDLDIPLVARHFYHHAGWAQLLDSEFPGYEACGVVGQIIPWNFPLLMLAWKIAPSYCDRKYSSAEARRIHSAHRACVCRDLPGDRAAGRSRQHRHRRWFYRRGTGETSGRRQNCIHRVYGGWARDPQCDGEEPQAAFAGAGRQVSVCSFRGCRSGQRSGRLGGWNLA